MLDHTAEKPVWAYSQRQADITDVWVEEVDPENETGVAVTAHMSEDNCGGMQINGIEVEDIGVTLFYDRLEAIKFIGTEALYRIEDVETEAHYEDAASA